MGKEEITQASSKQYGAGGKEETRKELAILLLRNFSTIIGFSVGGTIILIWFGKIEPDKAVTIVLAVSNIFSGILGSALTYYFSK